VFVGCQVGYQYMNNEVNDILYFEDHAVFSLHAAQMLFPALIMPSIKMQFVLLENLESPGILLWHFPGLESPGKRLLVLESSGNLLNSSKKYEMYDRQ